MPNLIPLVTSGSRGNFMPERTFSIGHVSSATGCKVETIRFYEGIGLLPEPERTQGNQRRYLASHIDRLRFILHARELGLTVEAIRQLISLSENPAAPCEQVDEIARQQLLSVRTQNRPAHPVGGGVGAHRGKLQRRAHRGLPRHGGAGRSQPLRSWGWRRQGSIPGIKKAAGQGLQQVTRLGLRGPHRSAQFGGSAT